MGALETYARFERPGGGRGGGQGRLGVIFQNPPPTRGRIYVKKVGARLHGELLWKKRRRPNIYSSNSTWRLAYTGRDFLRLGNIFGKCFPSEVAESDGRVAKC